jgi:hypothetical protein
MVEALKKGMMNRKAPERQRKRIRVAAAIIELCLMV